MQPYQTRYPAVIPPALLKRLKAEGLTPVGPFASWTLPVRQGVYLVLARRIPGQKVYAACARRYVDKRWEFGSTFMPDRSIDEVVTYARDALGSRTPPTNPFVWYGFEKVAA